jgi:hypothetical protein
MKKMKLYFKTVILLLGISLFLWNCDNDSEIIDNSNHINSKVKMIHQNFDFIKNNSNLLNKLSSLSKSKNVSSKSIEINDFIIFTNNVTYTSHTDNNTEHTYSFYIKRKGTLTNNTVENLVLKYQDGVYKSYILKYYFPQGIYNSNESFELIYVEEIDDLSDSILARGCYDKYDYIMVETEHKCASGQHVGADEILKCSLSGSLKPYSTWAIKIVVKEVCFEGESGGLSGGTVNDTGGPSGGSTPSDNPSTTIDTGITLPACQTDDCGDAVNTANHINSLLDDSLNDQQLIWLFNYPNEADSILTFLNANNSIENQNFINQAIKALSNGSYLSFEEILLNRTSLDLNSANDPNNNSIGGYDNTPIPEFNANVDSWPFIGNVIPITDFVGWGEAGLERDCMTYAKEQLRKAGYQISNYGDTGQTYQVYTEQNGINLDNTGKGVAYLISALHRGIPVIVGVDYEPGSVYNKKTDNSTDHFVVIVGMGTDSNGKNYFNFFDNGSYNRPYYNWGASLDNKFYFDSVTGSLMGSSKTPLCYNMGGTYQVTQIRKSKPL